MPILNPHTILYPLFAMFLLVVLVMLTMAFRRLHAVRTQQLSPSFLKLVTDGQRNLGPDGVRGFTKALKLTKEEASFFANLVGFNQARDDGERNEWYRRLWTSRK